MKETQGKKEEIGKEGEREGERQSEKWQRKKRGAKKDEDCFQVDFDHKERALKILQSAAARSTERERERERYVCVRGIERERDARTK